MTTLFYVAAWVLLVIVVLLAGHVRALQKRHQREIVNIIDYSLTARNHLARAKQEIGNYQRIRAADDAMIERLLKGLEQDKEARMEMMILLAKYRSLSGLAYERLEGILKREQGVELLGKLPSVHFIRETLRQIVNLETKPDAGITKTPGDGTGQSPATA